VVVIVDRDDELGRLRSIIVDVVEPTLSGMGELVSTRGSEARSDLLPTRRMLNLGDARARASFRKGCKARKEG
jgi:hypothetical protein